MIHHTGDCRQAMAEIWRVQNPGGRAIISNFYRRPSWMLLISRLGRENIEFEDADPPVTEFMREGEFLGLFEEFEVVSVSRDHYLALPIARRGWKAVLYEWGFRPLYNLLPRAVAQHLVYKLSVTGIRKG